eukprot:CAMPEP_0196662168 /NCGR_PEP_ID=MMETSP1086-20130531/47469_1 /TAXON_ID=77921 /ORGANISM="Cyanoptyche  gloeocystis , Strain SAG4.97" /LENGTH=180 /DNA_ID=CAMNT_0041997399 /DNA_START=40 /DNA_END=582 /DNA_ORIENTATION=-
MSEGQEESAALRALYRAGATGLAGASVGVMLARRKGALVIPYTKSMFLGSSLIGIGFFGFQEIFAPALGSRGILTSTVAGSVTGALFGSLTSGRRGLVYGILMYGAGAAAAHYLYLNVSTIHIPPKEEIHKYWRENLRWLPFQPVTDEEARAIRANDRRLFELSVKRLVEEPQQPPPAAR